MSVAEVTSMTPVPAGDQVKGEGEGEGDVGMHPAVIKVKGSVDMHSAVIHI